MPSRTKTKRKTKATMSIAEKLRLLRRLRGIFPKEIVRDPVAWQRKKRRDRKII